MIYCVEDDAGIREIEVYALRSVGFSAEGVASGAELFDALGREKAELVILDIMLPDLDGVEILKKLRAGRSTADIPIIMATAKGAEYDKVQSLDLGADDYLVKPFGVMEMISRVRAVLRRCGGAVESDTLRSGSIELSARDRAVKVGGEEVKLTYKEFELLKLFMENAGRVFTREQLFSSVWGMDYCGETRTVDAHIRTLRQKLGASGGRIETVRNVGYRFSAEER